MRHVEGFTTPHIELAYTCHIVYFILPSIRVQQLSAACSLDCTRPAILREQSAV